LGSASSFVRQFGSGLAEQAHGERNEEENNEDCEKDLGNASGCASDATKSENAGDQGDDEKNKGVIEHWGLSCCDVGKTDPLALCSMSFGIARSRELPKNS
jgi:hypothetical protein